MIYGLTPGQHRALAAIRDFIAQHGHSPTFVELREQLDLKSSSSVGRYVDVLIERGYLRRLPGRARSLAIIEKGERR